jgi:hypothetical protein
VRWWVGLRLGLVSEQNNRNSHSSHSAGVCGNHYAGRNEFLRLDVGTGDDELASNAAHGEGCHFRRLQSSSASSEPLRRLVALRREGPNSRVRKSHHDMACHPVVRSQRHATLSRNTSPLDHRPRLHFRSWPTAGILASKLFQETDARSEQGFPTPQVLLNPTSPRGWLIEAYRANEQARLATLRPLYAVLLFEADRHVFESRMR